MRNSDMAVVVCGIRKTYGKVVALADISFDVGRGEVIGLLGPNAAGKTTMVDILSTLTRPDRGSATVAGYDVASEPAGVRRSSTCPPNDIKVPHHGISQARRPPTPRPHRS